MTNWIHGGGFWLIQPTREYSQEELTAELDEFERKIEAAKRKIAMRKEKSA